MIYGGVPDEVLTFSLENYEIILSHHLVDELVSKLKLKVNAPYRWLRLFRLALEKTFVMAVIDELPKIQRDPDDEHVVAAALAENCHFIITGDKDLLDLESYQSIEIITPYTFLEQVKVTGTPKK